MDIYCTSYFKYENKCFKRLKYKKQKKSQKNSTKDFLIPVF